MADVQPPEGLQKIAFEAVDNATDAIAGAEVWRVADAVLASLFEACEVREQSHMWFVDGTRSPRYLVLWYQLPDEPIPPVPEGLAELIRSRIGDPPPVSSTGEERTGDA